MSEIFSEYNEKTYRLLRGLRRTNPELDPSFVNNHIEPQQKRRTKLVPVYENAILAHCIIYGEFWYSQITGHEIVYLDDVPENGSPGHKLVDIAKYDDREAHDTAVGRDMDTGSLYAGDPDAGSRDPDAGVGDPDAGGRDPDAGDNGLGAGDPDADASDPDVVAANQGAGAGTGDMDTWSKDLNPCGGDLETGARGVGDAVDIDTGAGDLDTCGGITKLVISEQGTYTYEEYCMYKKYDTYRRRAVKIPDARDKEAGGTARYGSTEVGSAIRDLCVYKKNDTHPRKDSKKPSGEDSFKNKKSGGKNGFKSKKTGGEDSCKREVRRKDASQFPQYQDCTYRLLRGWRRTDPVINPAFAESKDKLKTKRTYRVIPIYSQPVLMHCIRHGESIEGLEHGTELQYQDTTLYDVSESRVSPLEDMNSMTYIHYKKYDTYEIKGELQGHSALDSCESEKATTDGFIDRNDKATHEFSKVNPQPRMTNQYLELSTDTPNDEVEQYDDNIVLDEQTSNVSSFRDHVEDITTERGQGADLEAESLEADSLESDIAAKSQEDDLADESVEAGLADESLQADIAAKSLEDDLADESVEAGLADESIQADIAAKSLEDDLADESVEAGLADESLQANIAARSLEDDIADESVKAGLADESIQAGIAAKSLEDDVADESVEAGLEDESIQADIAAKSLQADIAAESIQADIEAESLEADLVAECLKAGIEAERLQANLLTGSKTRQRIQKEIQQKCVVDKNNKASTDIVTATADAIETRPLADTQSENSSDDVKTRPQSATVDGEYTTKVDTDPKSQHNGVDVAVPSCRQSESLPVATQGHGNSDQDDSLTSDDDEDYYMFGLLGVYARGQ